MHNNICIIGSGYVGLVTAACFAASGNKVYCIDKDNDKVEKLKKGICPIYEPGLEKLLNDNLKNNSLVFDTNIHSHLNKCTCVFIAVGTPPNEDGSADLKHVLEVAKEIAITMDSYKIVINKSTVPVGTADKVRGIIKDNTNIDFDVCSNPEFLKEGSAVRDFMTPDRIVVGCDNKKVEEVLAELYHPFTLKGSRIVSMDIKSAELTKYAANCYLATRISFINHISRICELLGADVRNVRKGIGTDKRIGLDFLYAGIGYGGSCFPKDIKALINTCNAIGYENKLLKTIEEINYTQRENFVNKILNYYYNDISGKKFAVWGLSFKPNTDDMREAPAITIINALIENGAEIKAYDPIAMDNAKDNVFGDKIEYGKSKYEIIKDCDALIVLTEWMEFRHPDFIELKKLLNKPVVIDGRNIYEIKVMNEHGFDYISIGHKDIINNYLT